MANLGEIMSDETPVITEVAQVEGTIVEEQAAPPATPPAPEAPKQEDKFAAKFAALSRQEKTIKQKQAELARKEAEIAAKEKEWQTKLSEREQELGAVKGKYDKFKSNPLAAAAEEGYDFEALTRMQLNEQNPTPEMLIARVQKEMDAKYSKQLEELKAQLAEKETKTKQEQIEQAQANYKKSIALAVEQNAEKYELIANTPYNGTENSIDLVYEVVEEFYNKNQRVLDVQEAADMVEKHLENVELQRREKLKKLKQASVPAAQAIKPAAKQTAPTLSNSLAQESPKNGPKPMSREESLKEAAKLIRWEE